MPIWRNFTAFLSGSRLSADNVNLLMANVNYLKGRFSGQSIIDFEKPIGIFQWPASFDGFGGTESKLPNLGGGPRSILVDGHDNELKYWNGETWSFLSQTSIGPDDINASNDYADGLLLSYNATSQRLEWVQPSLGGLRGEQGGTYIAGAGIAISAGGEISVNDDTLPSGSVDGRVLINGSVRESKLAIHTAPGSSQDGYYLGWDDDNKRMDWMELPASSTARTYRGASPIFISGSNEISITDMGISGTKIGTRSIVHRNLGYNSVAEENILIEVGSHTPTDGQVLAFRVDGSDEGLAWIDAGTPVSVVGSSPVQVTSSLRPDGSTRYVVSLVVHAQSGIEPRHLQTFPNTGDAVDNYILSYDKDLGGTGGFRWIQNSPTLANNSVTSAHIANLTIVAGDIQDRAITEPKLDISGSPGEDEDGYALIWTWDEDAGTGSMSWGMVMINDGGTYTGTTGININNASEISFDYNDGALKGQVPGTIIRNGGIAALQIAANSISQSKLNDGLGTGTPDDGQVLSWDNDNTTLKWVAQSGGVYTHGNGIFINATSRVITFRPSTVANNALSGTKLTPNTVDESRLKISNASGSSVDGYFLSWDNANSTMIWRAMSGGGGTTYSAGSGLTLTGAVFSLSDGGVTASHLDTSNDADSDSDGYFLSWDDGNDTLIWRSVAAGTVYTATGGVVISAGNVISLAQDSITTGHLVTSNTVGSATDGFFLSYNHGQGPDATMVWRAVGSGGGVYTAGRGLVLNNLGEFRLTTHALDGYVTTSGLATSNEDSATNGQFLQRIGTTPGMRWTTISTSGGTAYLAGSGISIDTDTNTISLDPRLGRTGNNSPTDGQILSAVVVGSTYSLEWIDAPEGGGGGGGGGGWDEVNAIEESYIHIEDSPTDGWLLGWDDEADGGDGGLNYLNPSVISGALSANVVQLEHLRDNLESIDDDNYDRMVLIPSDGSPDLRWRDIGNVMQETEQAKRPFTRTTGIPDGFIVPDHLSYSGDSTLTDGYYLTLNVVNGDEDQFEWVAPPASARNDFIMGALYDRSTSSVISRGHLNFAFGDSLFDLKSFTGQHGINVHADAHSGWSSITWDQVINGMYVYVRMGRSDDRVMVWRLHSIAARTFVGNNAGYVLTMEAGPPVYSPYDLNAVFSHNDIDLPEDDYWLGFSPAPPIGDGESAGGGGGNRPTLTITAGPDVTEGGTAQFTITSNQNVSNLGVSYTVTATGSYGVRTGASTATIGIRSTVIRIDTDGDMLAEAHGTITVTLEPHVNYVLGDPSSATLSVNDDDGTAPPATPTVEVSAGTNITEGQGGVFTFTASPAPASAIDILYAVSATNGFGISEGNKSVSMGTSGTVSVTIATTDDSTDELNGTITVSLRASSDYDIGTSNSDSLTVFDNDDPPVPVTPVVQISAGSAIFEGGRASFTLTATPAPSAPIVVNYNVSATDGFGVSEGNKSIGMSTSGTATIQISTTGDLRDESSGTISVLVRAGTGYTVGTNSSDSLRVFDDDPSPITIGDYVREGFSDPITAGNQIWFYQGDINNPSTLQDATTWANVSLVAFSPKLSSSLTIHSFTFSEGGSAAIFTRDSTDSGGASSSLFEVSLPQSNAAIGSLPDEDDTVDVRRYATDPYANP